MEITGLNHFNIKAPRVLLEQVRDFYVAVLGLTVGPRPNFSSSGYWLYAGALPLVHLSVYEDLSPSDGPTAGIDHVSFNCRNAAATLQKLEASGVAFRTGTVPALKQFQIFLRDPAGCGVELTFVGELEQCAINY
jgi:catechol 2,3-dioxygenase-like lactoylglutathione lyase family enzyme